MLSRSASDGLWFPRGLPENCTSLSKQSLGPVAEEIGHLCQNKVAFRKTLRRSLFCYSASAAAVESLELLNLALGVRV